MLVWKRFMYLEIENKQKNSSVGRNTSLSGNLCMNHIQIISVNTREKSCRYEVSQRHLADNLGPILLFQEENLLEISIFWLKSGHFSTGFHSCFTVF